MRSQPNFCSLAAQTEALLKSFQKEGDPSPHNMTESRKTTLSTKWNLPQKATLTFSWFLLCVFPQELRQMSVLPRQIWSRPRRVLVMRIQDGKTLWIKVASWISRLLPSLNSSPEWTLYVKHVFSPHWDISIVLHCWLNADDWFSWRFRLCLSTWCLTSVWAVCGHKETRRKTCLQPSVPPLLSLTPLPTRSSCPCSASQQTPFPSNGLPQHQLKGPAS